MFFAVLITLRIYLMRMIITALSKPNIHPTHFANITLHTYRHTYVHSYSNIVKSTILRCCIVCIYILCIVVYVVHCLHTCFPQYSLILPKLMLCPLSPYIGSSELFLPRESTGTSRVASGNGFMPRTEVRMYVGSE